MENKSPIASPSRHVPAPPGIRPWSFGREPATYWTAFGCSDPLRQVRARIENGKMGGNYVFLDPSRWHLTSFIKLLWTRSPVRLDIRLHDKALEKPVIIATLKLWLAGRNRAPTSQQLTTQRRTAEQQQRVMVAKALSSAGHLLCLRPKPIVQAVVQAIVSI